MPARPGPDGIRFDFNDGCRIFLPDGDWTVRLSDTDTGNTLFEQKLSGGVVMSTKKYFVPFCIDICAGNRQVFQHRFNAYDEEVLIQFPVGTLGDLLAWFPYAVKFQARHGCWLTCAMSPLLIPLFQPCYPTIRFISHDAVSPERFYACYRIGLYFDDPQCLNQPADFRLVGLHRTAGFILGVDPGEARPLIADADGGRPCEAPYVCIAAQSSSQCKYWNNPDGWREVVRFLLAQGYRVFCIDQKASYGMGLVWNHIPFGAEDMTGDLPITERARYLRHAAFFVGLSSGLSWLAWAVGTPVVMISGFTHERNEFATPYRVSNTHTCNSCWNDQRIRFDHRDFLWCPRHAGTPRQFECTKRITSEHVIRVMQPLCLASRAADAALAIPLSHSA